MVYIIIPYFQKEPGILRKAVKSVIAQTYLDWHLLISDDASTIPAKTELEDVCVPEGKITLICGPNGGPAKARNRGLDAIPPEVKYVAFLDSDDVWSESHLARAVHALDQGFDFYFSDFLQLGASVTAFLRAGRISASDHPLLDGVRLREYRGDFFDQILRGNIVGTSTVVYRYEKFKTQRFREAFFYAGEDYLFWMELEQKGIRIAFSAECEVVYGKGVNVYSGSGWGTEKSLDRLVNEIAFSCAIPKIFSINGEQKIFVKNKIKILRRAIALDIAHRINNNLSIQGKLLLRLIRCDAASLFFMLPNLLWSRFSKKST